jgi:hypothetical protein
VAVPLAEHRAPAVLVTRRERAMTRAKWLAVSFIVATVAIGAFVFLG